jgi:hypothetical protein
MKNIKDTSNEYWYIILENANIKDGNYIDMKKGMVTQFALEFVSSRIYSKNWSKLQNENSIKKSAKWNNNSRTYDVSGEIIYSITDPIASDMWIIDVGILSHSWGMKLSEWVIPGVYIYGKTPFVVAWYMYEDYYNKSQDIPPIIYTWEISRIFTGKDFDEEIEKTNSRHDDPSLVYLLECLKLPNPAVYRRTINN